MILAYKFMMVCVDFRTWIVNAYGFETAGFLHDLTKWAAVIFAALWGMQCDKLLHEFREAPLLHFQADLGRLSETQRAQEPKNRHPLGEAKVWVTCSRYPIEMLHIEALNENMSSSNFALRTNS